MGILQDITADLTEGKDEDGHRTFQTHKAWKAAVRKHKPDAEFYGDKDIGGAHGIGEWDGETGKIWKHAEPKKEVKESVLSPQEEIEELKLDLHHQKALAQHNIRQIRERLRAALEKFGNPAKELALKEDTDERLGININNFVRAIAKEIENLTKTLPITENEEKVELNEYSGPGFHHVYKDWKDLAAKKGAHKYKFNPPPREFGKEHKGHTLAYNHAGHIVATWNHHYNHGLIHEAYSQESTEALTELSKDTLKHYITRAAGNSNMHALRLGRSGKRSGEHVKKVSKRYKGIKTAVDKLARPEKPKPTSSFLKSINDDLKDNHLTKKQAN